MAEKKEKNRIKLCNADKILYNNINILVKHFDDIDLYVTDHVNDEMIGINDALNNPWMVR